MDRGTGLRGYAGCDTSLSLLQLQNWQTQAAKVLGYPELFFFDTQYFTHRALNLISGHQ